VRNLFLVLLFVGVAQTSEAGSTVALPSLKTPLAELGTANALLLGVIEGVTEFIPISSTGHLILITSFLDLDSNRALLSSTGEPYWYRRPSGQDPGELLTLNLAMQSYIVVIQFGAIAAVVPICWSQLMSMWRGLRGRDAPGLRLLKYVMIAFLPAAFIGLLVHDWIDENLYSVKAVIFALVAGALLMFYAERWRRRREEFRDITELGSFRAAGVGFLQCLAMWPGTSRPMMTIVGGYFAGLKPGPAAGFSFLLGFVTLTAASVFKGCQSGAFIIEVFGWRLNSICAVLARFSNGIARKTIWVPFPQSIVADILFVVE
jgi:undecaprenyl-diphosphatase